MANLLPSLFKIKDKRFYKFISIFDVVYFMIMPIAVILGFLERWPLIFMFIPNFIYSVGMIILLINFYFKADRIFTRYILIAYSRSLLNYYMFFLSICLVLIDMIFDEYDFGVVVVFCTIIILFELFVNFYWTNELKNVLERFEDEVCMVDSEISINVNKLID